MSEELKELKRFIEKGCGRKKVVGKSTCGYWHEDRTHKVYCNTCSIMMSKIDELMQRN